MSLILRPYRHDKDRSRALSICIAAFAPIHDGFRKALGQRIFDLHYGDWRGEYARTFAALGRDDGRTQVYMAETDDTAIGFVFTVLDAACRTGEVGLNAIEPAWQGRGHGTRMYRLALEALKRRGAEIAYVGTGADAAHRPARRAYEAAGFDRSIPTVHYFAEL